MSESAPSFAFLGHDSAIDALRHLGEHARTCPRWPEGERLLPVGDACIHGQRSFRELVADEDLASYGVTKLPVHLLTGDACSRSNGKSALFHVWKRQIPAASMLRLSRRLLVSGPELCMFQLAAYQLTWEPLFEEKLARFQADKREIAYYGLDLTPTIDHPVKWEHFIRAMRIAEIAMEFAGAYRLDVEGGKPNYSAGPIMSMASLAGMADRLPDAFGANRVRHVLDIAADGSASPMETSLFLMLTAPEEWGGFGLPKPLLNHTFDTAALRGSLAPGDEVTPDLLWPEARVALEYESDEFHAKWHLPKFATDAARANALSSMGYTVLRATPAETLDPQAIVMLARQIAALLGVPFAEADELRRHRRRLLHAELFPSRWDER